MNKEERNSKGKSEAALREEKVLRFWQENKIFEKSLSKKASKGHYVFYDGPPFATGQIHYGHILGSTAKDVIGRYKTMQGYFVPRKWGWDCHGLPIENIVEKELGVAGHKEIESLGIDRFVEYARSKVLQYDADWRKGIARIGRWVDFDNGYKTMDNTFIESVWWALSEFNKKNLIYEGVRVLAYCARCETPIANSEIAMDNSYKDIADISIYAKFELVDEPGTYLLAWTTTPWTLPGNTAIAINKKIAYVKVKTDAGVIIMAEDTVAKVMKDKAHTILGVVKAEDLISKRYEPVFPYYKGANMPNKENIWKVWHADFVTTEMGTGIAHEAPAFGEDDMNLAKEYNIPWIIHVDETGRFKNEVLDFAGAKVKPKDTEEDKDAHLRTDIEVIKYLQKTGAYFDKEKIVHSYPHCMRCDTPIIYYALPSWFINIQKVKSSILKNAKSINWIPSHLKEGRFKNITENAPDWNISRNRYWASPLPIWKCEKCKTQVFVDSLATLHKHTKKSGNKYFAMRHGEAIDNAKHIYDPKGDPNNHLTDKGREEATLSASGIKAENIDLIFSSPFLRTRETAEVVREVLGLSPSNVILDDRLHEINEPDQKFVFERIGDFIFEIEKKYSEKNILIISHGNPLWTLEKIAGRHLADYFTEKEMHNTAEVRELQFVPFPHNKDHELDLHRPYIDEVEMVCTHSTSSGQACGGRLARIPEVLDCWFESGSMPFAQDHYPFENKEWKSNNFPAGFIAEYIAQTRTWFYYTHVVSSVLFGQAAFQNVVTTGTLRAEDGEKMSKSKNNYPDPWKFIDQYGVDALRIYLMSSTLMKGEDANFSEKSVQDIASKIIGRLSNVLAFYELYRDPNLEPITYNLKPNSILDQWILARWDQVLEEVTKGMEMYDMAEAARPLDLFIEDVSTWYLRRSRERIKDGDAQAKATLYFVLKNLSRLIAPLAPFAAEDMWRRLMVAEDPESVHLAAWPHLTPWPLSLLRRGVGERSHVVKNMQIVRDVCTAGNAQRQKSGIPVRQPLSQLRIKNYELGKEYLELIQDELNVKEVVLNKNMDNEMELDTNVTSTLKAEGEYREFMRGLQEERKKLGLTPSDKMKMRVEDIYKKYKIFPLLANHMLKVAAVAKMICDNIDVPVDKENIILAALLHDMGNIIKVDFKKFPKAFEPEGVEYWSNVQKEFIEKYGSDEFEVSSKIIQEIGIPERAIELAKSNKFSMLCQQLESQDMDIFVTHYSDGRVSPQGVVSYEKRMEEAGKRYRNHHDSLREVERVKLVACGLEMEKQVFAKCKIRPEDITDESVAPIISELRNFVIPG